jgi:acetylornithine deacetylase/succinyl-diaminopimelate desuccinylase-like protein
MRRLPPIASVGLALLAAAPLAAQRPAAPRAAASRAAGVPAVPAQHPKVRQALASLQATNEWTLEQQASICEIPAPPFKEAARAAEYKRRLEALGLVNVRIDGEGNVIAERPGTGQGPTVVVSAHLDTVFPEGTDVTVKRDSTLLKAPGIGDDCRGLAVLLATARAMRDAQLQTTGRVLFVGTVGEEGPGNLRGVRHLFETSLKDSVDYFISVDGTGLGVTSGAVGSHRYKVTYKGPGGHSYGAFGMPNPIHALGRAMAKVADLQVPRQPRTTFSVGVIAGGTSVNSIAYEASMEVDMRSESEQSLGELDARFQAAIREALAEERARWPNSRAALELVVDTIGIRPAGTQPDSAPIVQVALRARDVLVEGKQLVVPAGANASSTDSNIPIALGIPAVTIDGGGQGRGSHSLDETYNDGRMGWLGPQFALLVVSALAGVR